MSEFLDETYGDGHSYPARFIIVSKVNIVSSSGIVHRADRYGKDVHIPVCNSNNTPYSAEYFKDWEVTTKEVTCKNCLRRKL